MRQTELRSAATGKELRSPVSLRTLLGLPGSSEAVRRALSDDTPHSSPVGLILLAASIIVMPWLARAKRLTGEALGSALVIADAAETRICAWLSVSTFAGLAAFSLFGWTWLDSVAGFVIAGFAVMEAREAWEGELACVDE
ncbi:MAG: cation transporter [Ilumatobacteraceae bacterium]